MNGQKNPGAVAALGASEIDQLVGKVGHQNSPRALNPQPLPLRAGDGVRCDSISLQNLDLANKRFELLREVAPNIHRLAIMANANNAAFPPMREMNTVIALARKFEIDPIPLEIRRTEDIESAFARLKSEQADALYVVIDELLNANRLLIVSSADAAKLPAIYGTHDWVRSGGLISYGSNFPVLFARMAEMVDSIMRGTQPEDIPIEQPTRFELVINLKTAKALGVPISATLLARADDVIE